MKTDIEKANLVWDEYKYRHSHCWQLVFQITAAVVTISIVPYIDKSIANLPCYIIVALPWLAVALTIFSGMRVIKEVRLWQDVRITHLHLQKILGFIKEIEPNDTFKPAILTYLLILGVLALAHAVIILVGFWPF